MTHDQNSKSNIGQIDYASFINLEQKWQKGQIIPLDDQTKAVFVVGYDDGKFEVQYYILVKYSDGMWYAVDIPGGSRLKLPIDRPDENTPRVLVGTEKDFTHSNLKRLAKKFLTDPPEKGMVTFAEYLRWRTSDYIRYLRNGIIIVSVLIGILLYLSTLTVK